MSIKLKYTCTHWGQEHLNAAAFFNRLQEAGYEGVEIFLQKGSPFENGFIQQLDDTRRRDPGFLFIPQMILMPDTDGINGLVTRTEKRLEEMAAWQPTFINAHTGRDYFSFDDNCRIIETCMNFTARTGIRVLHETHRGRFSFHAATLLKYLDKFPAMELVGDFSHFCVVSESMLDDQEAIMAKIIPHVAHIHARIGYEQGPQVNNPFAPEWSGHLNIFINWWKMILEDKQSKKQHNITVTPESGPVPYMPTAPFTKRPLADQWEVNLLTMKFLKTVFREYDPLH